MEIVESERKDCNTDNRSMARWYQKAGAGPVDLNNIANPEQFASFYRGLNFRMYSDSVFLGSVVAVDRGGAGVRFEAMMQDEDTIYDRFRSTPRSTPEAGMLALQFLNSFWFDASQELLGGGAKWQEMISELYSRKCELGEALLHTPSQMDGIDLN
jgi:hypothetical protein